MKRIWIYVSQRCVPEHCIHAGRKLYGRSRKSAGECRSINNIDTQPSLFISSFSPGAVVPVLVVDLARANPREGGSQRRQIPTELPTEKNENTQPPPSLFFSLPQLHDLLHRIHRQRLWPRLPCLLLANSRQTSASPSPLLLSLCSVQPYHFTLSSPLHIPVLYSLSGLLRVLGTCHCSFLSYYSFFFSTSSSTEYCTGCPALLGFNGLTGLPTTESSSSNSNPLLNPARLRIRAAFGKVAWQIESCMVASSTALLT